MVAVLVGCLATAGVAQGQGATAPPIVPCAWSLMDADHDAGTGFDFGPDDRPDELPAAPGRPCRFDAVSGRVQQDDAVAGMIQVQPNPGPSSSPVQVASYVTASQAIGGSPVTAVSAEIVAPDGRIHGQLVGSDLSCGDSGAPDGPWRWASPDAGGTGALAGSAITNQDGLGLRDRCVQGDVDLYGVVWEVDAADPCGDYEVVFTVETRDAETRLTHGIDVICFTHLEIDFDSLDWTIAPGAASTIAGDSDPATPDRPTISNHGNTPLVIGIELSALANADGATLDDFEVTIGDLADGGFDVTPGEVFWFDGAGLAGDTDPTVLCGGTRAPLTVTLHAPPVPAPGPYQGDFTIWSSGTQDARCPTGTPIGASDAADQGREEP